MEKRNEMKIEFDSRSCNEGFARVAVAAFLTQLDPTLEEISDVKTAVSEAVTNAIIHGYEGKVCSDREIDVNDKQVHKVQVLCCLEDRQAYLEVVDHGIGMEDVKQAMEPLYTTKPDQDRSGMGFAFMEAFMDRIEVESEVGRGTRVMMWKTFGATKEES